MLRQKMLKELYKKLNSGKKQKVKLSADEMAVQNKSDIQTSLDMTNKHKSL